MMHTLPLIVLVTLPFVRANLFEHAARFQHEVVNLTGPKPLSSISHDDVLDRQGCKPLTVLFAADSTDSGNVGSTAGRSFVQALASKIGGRQEISIQGIDYPVDYNVYSEEWEYWESRDTEGPKMMAALAAQVMEECPLTHLVLGGSGQGAQLVHDAASQMSKNILDFVRAAVIFGEGTNAKRLGYTATGKLNRKIKTYCRGTDPFCPGKKAIGDSRITYTRDAGKAAHFVLHRIIGRR